MKICITDATFKHSLGLARYLKEYDSTLKLIGITEFKPKTYSLYKRQYDHLEIGPLSDILKKIEHDLVIPVGNKSVELISRLQQHKAILPKKEMIDLAISKRLTAELAENLGIPVPKTYQIMHIEDISNLQLTFPCIVKGALEAGKNLISYPKNKKELHNAVTNFINDPSQQQTMPIIQEYVPGVGLGFFAFYQKGILKRFYMHQRIRELPITGGSSTAAKTIFHPKGFEYGKMLLDKLEWHGPAMVEFRYDPLQDKLWLMEINPKFWGSTELGLAAGVNFGEFLLRTIKGESLQQNLSVDSYKRMQFFWPVDGDITALIKKGNYQGFVEYLKGGYSTNLSTYGFGLSLAGLIKTLKQALS